MSNKNRGLGKGLSELLGDSAVAESLSDTPSQSPKGSSGGQGEKLVPIEHISPSAWQPRQVFDTEDLADLAKSIRSHGVVQPLLVRHQAGKKDRFELIAGERRWRAAQLAGMHELPVVVREADNALAAQIALVENIQRRDLNAIEEASGYARLVEEHGYTQEELAGMLGKSRSHLANTMRLLQLPEAVQAMLSEGTLTAGQARPLIGHKRAVALAHTIVAKGMSARQAEALAAQKERPKSSQKETSPDLKALERTLRQKHGLAISLAFSETTQKGKITIKCQSLEQFEAMLARLK